MEEQKVHDDKTLWNAYMNQDTKAFEQIYERHKGLLFVYILGMIRSKDLAEDLLQDVMMDMVKKGNSRTQIEDIRAYMLTIARRRCIDHIRRSQKRKRQPKEEDLILESPQNTLESQEKTRRINRYLFDLPDEQREVIILHLYKGLTFEEISGITDAPVGTVTSRYRYGLQKLKDSLLRDPYFKEELTL
jgi:RNA polymerase sigma-70 factor (ECF subfamily)